jgi:DNA gyrase inhibitor GyrI
MGDDMDVRIVEIGEMRVASFHALGEHPEMEAIRKMQAWAKPRGLIGDGKYPVFGFDNPPPSPGRREYGYEVWVVVGDDTDAAGATVKHIPAAKYATMRSEGLQNVGPNWRRLAGWVRKNGYEPACAQCLEGHVPGSSETGYFALDLYFPIK